MPLFLLMFGLLAKANDLQRPSDIVNLHDIDPSIQVEMMYFQSENFLGHPVRGYMANVCLLTKPAAIGLKNAQRRLKAEAVKRGQSLSLQVRDCYRPQKSVQHFVEWVKDPKALQKKQTYYPDLTKAQLIQDNYISPVSGHSRASSVDLTIVEVSLSGIPKPIAMGTVMDFFGERSHSEYPGVTAEEKSNRQLLKKVLEPEFKNYSKEWWHFVLKVEPYPRTFFDFDIQEESSSRSLTQSTKDSDVVTQVTEPELLAHFDQNHASLLSLSRVLVKIQEMQSGPIPEISATERSYGSVLKRFDSTYGKMANVFAADVTELVNKLGIDWEKDITKTYDSTAAKTEAGKRLRENGNVTRVFNEKWLTSAMGQFSLVGIINRIDRKDFVPGTCGEVRLIYRLGYETEMQGNTYASKLPFTLNLVFSYADDGNKCQTVAQTWRIAKNARQKSEQLLFVQNLANGPLNWSRLRFRQMEVNAQVARFPSDLENQEHRNFAGQAIYLMRIFSLQNGSLVPKKLENTPDVQALLKDDQMKKKLTAFIQKNLIAIDKGVFQIPDEFLADVALSFSTLGSSRLANKPFEAIYTTAEAELIMKGAVVSNAAVTPEFISSGPALLERLNTSSCMGCHQTSSTAGFHLLGEDRFDNSRNSTAVKSATDGNRLVLPFSPHLFAELPRRAHYVAQLVSRKNPNSFRPHPSAPPATWNESQVQFQAAGDNMPCPLLSEATFAASAKWACDVSRGLKCELLVENASAGFLLGQCIPSKERISSGLSCRKNAIADSIPEAAKQRRSQSLGFNLKAFADRNVKDTLLYPLTEGKLGVDEYNCRPTRIGVPLGRVTRNCNPEQKSLAKLVLSPLPDEMCAVVGGKGFEEMAKGYFSSQKFSEGVGRGLLNTCSPTRFCREDYICQQMPDFLTTKRFGVAKTTIKTFREKKVGFCTPTYFVYQLRLDGHPNPM